MTLDIPDQKWNMDFIKGNILNFSRISSSDIFGFFFCFSAFLVCASGGVVLFSEGEEIGEVATSLVGGGGRGSITERVYICCVGRNAQTF